MVQGLGLVLLGSFECSNYRGWLSGSYASDTSHTTFIDSIGQDPSICLLR